MKDLIHSAVALVLGIIIGVLTTILGLIGLGAYVYLDESDKRKSKTGPKTRYTGPSAVPKTDEPKAEEKN